jgi:hypothetical protein
MEEVKTISQQNVHSVLNLVLVLLSSLLSGWIVQIMVSKQVMNFHHPESVPPGTPQPDPVVVEREMKALMQPFQVCFPCISILFSHRHIIFSFHFLFLCFRSTLILSPVFTHHSDFFFECLLSLPLSHSLSLSLSLSLCLNLSLSLCISLDCCVRLCLQGKKFDLGDVVAGVLKGIPRMNVMMRDDIASCLCSMAFAEVRLSVSFVETLFFISLLV